MIRKVRSIFNPDMFQGWGRRKRYFEGWYFKIVNSTADRIYAVIPGISIDRQGSGHSFIQLLDGINTRSEYFTFPYEYFKPNRKKFEIEIAGNYFSDSHLRLELPGFKADLNFSNNYKWPNRWYAPGIMGPYTFAPFMECNHGVLNMRNSISGELQHKEERIDFTGGRGYLEKDWGHSFPKAYIWLQSNHFKDPDTSLKMSIANIPWLRKSFTGYIAGLLHNGTLYEFTTYNGSKILKLQVSLKEINVVLASKKYILDLQMEREKATRLASPISGEMSGHILESMRSVVRLTLKSRKSAITILRDNGVNTALEVAGNIELLYNH